MRAGVVVFLQHNLIFSFRVINNWNGRFPSLCSGLLQSFQKVTNYLKFQEGLLLLPWSLCNWEIGIVSWWDDRRMFLLKFLWVKKRERREIKLCFSILNLLHVRLWFTDLSDLLISLWAPSPTFAPVEQSWDVHKQGSCFQHITRIIYRSGPVDGLLCSHQLHEAEIAWNSHDHGMEPSHRVTIAAPGHLPLAREAFVPQ